MAKVKLNPALISMLGKVGNLVYKMRYGSIYASRKPAAGTRHFNDAQRAVQRRFRAATDYGKALLADPVARSPYDVIARAKRKPVLSVMVADFLNAPVIDEIDLVGYDGQAGSTIRIRATDDFEVSLVEVLIYSASGERIEGGPATLRSGNSPCWVYKATTSVPPGTRVRVEATARDRPGNRTTSVENM